MNGKALLFVLGSITGALAAYMLSLSFGSSNDLSRSPYSPTAGSADDRFRVPASFSASATSAEVRQVEEDVARDSTDALLDAAALQDPAARRRAVMLVGAVWARTDPVAALQQAYRLPPVLKADFQASVSSEWANMNAAEFMRYAASAPDAEVLTKGLELLVASDPARVLEIAGRLPPETGNVQMAGLSALEQSALSALAELDPAAAMRFIEPMLGSINVDIIAQDVVTRFARNDPEAALAWLSSLDSVTTSHVRVVVGGIARVDFQRALSLAAGEPTSFDMFDSALAAGAVSDSANAAEAADILMNDGSSFAARVLEQVAASWARRDPERFTDWFLANFASVTAPLARSVAAQFASTDLERALRFAERLPPDMRSTWIAEIAGPYASRDPVAAFDWIEQYRDEPFYEDVRSQIVVRTAEANPQLAATMIDGLSPALKIVAAPRIAATMAARDPRAAGEWALGLDDPAAASGAVSSVVSSWLRRDTEAARSWVIDLERGEIRDNALSALISASFGTNLDPRPILAEIDSATTRGRARQMAVYRNAGSQPEILRELLEAMLDDPEYVEFARDTLQRLDESQD